MWVFFYGYVIPFNYFIFWSACLKVNHGLQNVIIIPVIKGASATFLMVVEIDYCSADCRPHWYSMWKSHERANKTRFSTDTTNMLLQLWLEYIMGVSQEWYQTVWIGSTQHTAHCQAQMIKPEWNWPVCKGLLRARIIKVFHPPPLPHIDLRITRRFINTKCLTGNAVTLGIKLQLQKWNKKMPVQQSPWRGWFAWFASHPPDYYCQF